MNSFEINKILGAVLGTCLFLLAVHIASGAIFTPATPAKPGYEIAVKEEQPAAGGGAAAPKEVPIAQLLASASAQQGEQTAKVCLTCHNMGKGQGNKVGPDLYGVVGRAVASESGLQLLRIAKGERRHLDLRYAQSVAGQPAQGCPRHAHDLRRPAEREAARRRHRLSQRQFRQPTAAAEGGRCCAGRRRQFRATGFTAEIDGSLPAVHLAESASHADVKAISSRFSPGTLAPQFKST